MSNGHERVPNWSGVTAARRARHGTIVIVTKPDDSDIFASEADEPDVLRPGAGAGLAYSVRESELGAPSCAVLDDLLQHPIHLLGHFAFDDLGCFGFVAVAAVDQFALRVDDVEDTVGPRQLAAVRKRGDTARMLQRCDAAVAERHRAGFADALDAEALRQLDDLFASDLE